MAIFQKSVINKHLSILDKIQIDKAYEKFIENYSPAKIAKIKTLKEEEYQDGFLRDIFVNVLGYTLKPDEGHNLEREFKNQTDSKKADGAIIKDEKAIVVIELKSTKTRDLKNVTQQAFNYKNNQPECKYVITSNFQKLRFYIDHANEFEEFDLFNLNRKEFELFYLILNKDNIFADIPLALKTETEFHDQEISGKLYKDYSSFKRKLFENLVKNNAEADKLTLFIKSQKLLDRFLFILFAEDSGLLPPNSISRIVEHFHKLEELDAYKSIYDIFKQYFGYMNVGRKGKNSPVDDIPAYNGGLFYVDDLLDNLKIDDDILIDDLKGLSAYDFNTDIDVNILGHIFEHSLSEIEEITAEIGGTTTDKSKSKRKKDGVFYTPKYITTYIVENTIGTLCDEKRQELGIGEIEFDETYRTKADKLTVKGKKLYQQFMNYKDWLISLKIVDPACGSGAFLNQALNYLIQEHKDIDDFIAELTNTLLPIFDIDKTILENNLYGVDINEESIEIAKLSLWLRTAQKGRKLSNLNGNIKCGNSLISDKEVASDKAFDWNIEFKDIMDNGGFDVVIGNPPYVRAELLGEFQNYFAKQFDVYHPSSDLFAYFYELGVELISNNGVMAYISNTFDKTKAGEVLREYLVQNTTFEKYIDFTEAQVFDGATTYPVIIILNKTLSVKNQFDYIKIPKTNQSTIIDINFHNNVHVKQNTLEPQSWSFLPVEKVIIFKKMKKLQSIREAYGKCYRGLITGLNEAFLVQNYHPLSDHLKFIYEGKEIKKWNTPTPKQKLIFFKSKWTKATYGDEILEKEALNIAEKDFPELIKHLKKFEDKAKKRYDKGQFWWELRNCAYYDLFDKPKIIFPNLQNANKFCLDSQGVFINAPAVFLPVNSKTLLCVLNSKIVWEFLKSICVVRSGGYIEVKPQYFEQIPIPELKNEDLFEQKADEIIDNTKQLQEAQSNFTNYLQSQFSIEKFSKKLNNWYELEFGDFIKELNKAIKKAEGEKLTKIAEMEWMEVFETKKSEAQALKTDIDKTDAEIEQMVYKLYELTDEEIAVVEGAL